MTENCNIDVFVCTYRRQQKLKECIESIIAQKLESSIALRIVVVDNDKDQTGRQIVELLGAKSGIPIVYLWEPQRGISHARNKCLDAIKAKYFCFIDDDEIAAPTWVQNLYQTLHDFNADVVAGPVIATYHSNTPRWVIESKIFERNRKHTGDSLECAATGNCMLRSSSVQRSGIRFDHRFSLSGGEDSDFFIRLLSSGYTAVFCDEAEVFEEAARDRMTMRYWMLRSIRGGQTYAMTHYKGMSNSRLLYLVSKKIVHLIAATCMLILNLPRGRARYIRWLIRASSSYGQLSSFYGKKIEMY